MKSGLLTTVSVVVWASVSQAADPGVGAPPRAVQPLTTSWAGGYGGLQGGVVEQYGKFLDFDGFLWGVNVVLPVHPQVPTTKGKHTGGAFGGHIGYNWQSDEWVYGLEADGSGVFAKFTAPAPTLFYPEANVSFDVSWLATLRARAGFLISPDTLLYVTGGLAVGHVRNAANLVENGSTIGTMTQEATRAGWVVGGGFEYMFSRRWTARAEVRYVDFGKSTVTCDDPACPGGPYRGEFSNQLLMGLVGTSLKF
jgi:outer membrane immunogenic protein